MNNFTDVHAQSLIRNADDKAQMGETSVLAKRAILVYANLSAWGGQKIDRKHTDELLLQKGAYYDGTTQVVQKLLQPMVKACRKEIAAMRTRHYELTLPYHVKGWAILPSAMYFDYMREMKAMETKIWNTIDEQLSRYDEYLYDERRRKNGLFVAEMYPTQEEIRAQYNVQFRFNPIPDAGNWIVDVEREEMEKLRASVEAESISALQTCIREQWTRLHKVVNHMADALSTFGDVIEGSEAGKTRTFRDSLVNNVEDICNILPKLNLTGDAQLAAMIGEVHAKLTTYDPKVLRTDPSIRKDTLKEANAILASMEAYMGFIPSHVETEEAEA